MLTIPSRQGPYSTEGDIVVLCAYLGQLSRLREALSNEVAVVLDERDQAELDDRNAEDEDVTQSRAAFERVKVSRRVSKAFVQETDFYLMRVSRFCSARSITSKAKRQRFGSFQAWSMPTHHCCHRSSYYLLCETLAAQRKTRFCMATVRKVG